MSRITRTTAFIFLASTALSTTAMAQDAPEAAPEEAIEGDFIIVTGTRAVGQAAADSAAPIQLLSDDALTRVGQPNLNQALTQLVPSFQAQTQGTDMASFSLSARLRGVSPNHTLVMVNGKRRHGNSILQVINGAFGGSAAPSIDLIPPDMVERIEILQDGAAAVYGSDAIAGVINIILKSDTDGASVRFNAGQYYDNEGASYSVSGNFGMEVGDAGFLDVSLFHRENGYTTIGDGQISVVNVNGTINSGVSVAFRPLYQALADNGGTANINGGQPASNLNVAIYNFGYDFDAFELYSFGNVSRRTGDALQGYRVPNRVCRNPLTATAQTSDPTNCFGNTAATGLVPHIEVFQNEFSFTGGLRGETDSGWTWDVSATYAEDRAKVYTTGSVNASLYVATGFSPTDFYDGGFQFNQFVSTVDISKELEVGMAEPMTIAFGGEFRDESYEVFQGDAGSLYIEGGQSFPGYSPTDASKIDRNAKAAYANVILYPVDGWTVDVAGRYEDYSDFGDTLIGKLTTRYDFSDAFALRGTVSTGFRAPTLAESGYSATNVGPTSAVLQLAPSSAGAASAGFGALGPEESFNISLGTVIRPAPLLTMTLDGYYLKINDRIVSSGTIIGQDASPVPTPAVPRLTPLINGLTPYQLVLNAIAASGKVLDPTVVASGQLGIQTFTNGIDTETWGLEFAARYPVDLPFGSLDLSLGANYNITRVTDSSALGTLFVQTAEDTIENASPDYKINLGALFESGAFSANARMNYYGKTTQLVRPNGFSTTPRPVLNYAGVGEYYRATVGATPIFDLELAYDFTDWMEIAVGANNLLNKKPEIPDLVADYNPATWPTNNRSPYINNTGVINQPYTFGPYGTNGGYYYARLTLNF
ncbi:TonB-dependent receptor plug domain-containing protein [Alteraurantiacibacter buctensis]|uniref:TonB-dependent receptor n=1 Tax=Alteraurantiacibacter buctensis TaxID=1503981 RepID=A0A844YVE9_9SPHN|nr:TonB-dependent receptor [Alteraurantiacibacter buctensis]MXO71000.1 TonB-dependent receptor [Alteraurantiacibacter buctensis]